MPFEYVNKALKKNFKLINASFRLCGLRDTVIFADHLMYTGFGFAAKAVFPLLLTIWKLKKSTLLAEANAEVKEIEDQYRQGLVTNGERYNKVVDIWGRVGDKIAKAMMDNLSKQKLSTVTATKSIKSHSTPFI